jgi:DNA-binding transcriptional MerR regulator
MAMDIKLGLLLTCEAAELLRISPRTLEKWRSIGGGPVFVKLGRRALYKFSDLEAFQEARRYEATSIPVPVMSIVKKRAVRRA